LRGKGRDQHGHHLLRSGDSRRAVSVPLRGKGRDQHLIPVVLEGFPREMFPSPCGEKVGINPAEEKVERPTPVLLPKVSVPLRGKGRDQRRGSQTGQSWVEHSSLFPSPCGEKVGINGAGRAKG